MSTASVTFHSADKFTTIRIKFKRNGAVNPGVSERQRSTQEDLGCLLRFASLVFVSTEEVSSLQGGFGVSLSGLRFTQQDF